MWRVGSKSEASQFFLNFVFVSFFVLADEGCAEVVEPTATVQLV
jgi:hypothetical protein